jgi:hypothetical protein
MTHPTGIFFGYHPATKRTAHVREHMFESSVTDKILKRPE